MEYKVTGVVDIYENRYGDTTFLVEFDKNLWEDFKKGKFFFDFNNGDWLSKDYKIIGDYFIAADDIDNEDDRSEVYTYKNMDIIWERDEGDGYVEVKFTELVSSNDNEEDEEEDYEN